MFENMHNLRKKIEDLRRAAEVAEREGNLERVAKSTTGNFRRRKKILKYSRRNISRPKADPPRAESLAEI